CKRRAKDRGIPDSHTACVGRRGWSWEKVLASGRILPAAGPVRTAAPCLACRSDRLRERIPMRALPATLCLLLASPALTAAPAPAAGQALSPAAREQLHAESLSYAQQLLSVANQISLTYVRP